MKRIIRLTLLLGLFSAAMQLTAQNFYVLNGTVHTGADSVIENAAIIVKDGKILDIMDARLIKIDPNFGPIVEASGKHIYPGLIAGYTTLGLTEVDYLRQTKDYREVGQFTPNIRSLIAYNTDSRILPTVRSNGILFAQIVPEGGFISGSSSVVKTQAWNWEDAVVAEDEGIHLWWPQKFVQTGWWAQPGPIKEDKKYSKKTEEIKQFLERARAYWSSADPGDTDITLEAMKGVFEGNQNLYIHVHGASEIIAAIHLAEELGIEKPVVVGGAEADKVVDLLKEYDVPVMLTAIHKLPPRRHNDINHWYQMPSVLHEAGVLFCLTFGEWQSSFNGAWENRNLPFLAGSAAAHGLDRETALAAITSNVSKIIGMDYSGTVTPGEDATFLISEGDLLDMRTSHVTQAWIKGQSVDLTDKHKVLYERFVDKYKEEGTWPEE